MPDCRAERSGVQAGDAAVGSNNEGERERIPVAVVERLPGAAVIAAYVGAVSAGGDPESQGF